MEKPRSSRFKAWVIVALTVVLAFVAGWVLNYIYGDALRNQVVASINSKLKAKVAVQEIDFTVFSSFPYAAVRFSDIRIDEPEGIKSSGTLLTAQKISFRFRLWDLFTGNVKLTGVEVIGAQLSLFKNQKGQVNYDIFKDDTTSTQSLEVNLRRIALQDLQLTYVDQQSARAFQFNVTEADVSGELSQDVFAAQFEGDLQSATVKIGSITYLDQKPTEITASLSADINKGFYRFASSTVKVAGMTFNLSGDWVSHEYYDDFNISFSSKDANISSLISLLPAQATKGFSKFNCTGEVAFNGRLSGRYGSGNTPVFSVDFIARNASANPEGTSYKITALNGTGSFTSRKSNAYPYESLTLQSISAKLEGAPFKLDLRLENFANPILDLNLQLDADLGILSKFYMPDTVESISGSLSADIRFNGIAKEKNTYKSNGTLNFKNAAFKIKGSPIDCKEINGALHLREDDMVLENMNAKLGGSDIQVSGSFENLVGFLLLDNQQLNVKASLSSDFIDLDEFFINSPSDNDSNAVSFTSHHQFALDLNIAQLKFRKFQATNITGDVVLGDAQLISSGLIFGTCGGEIKLGGSINGQTAENLKINCNAQIRNVNISMLFQQMGNFGQTTLIDKNLKGSLSAKVEMQSVWDRQLNLDEGSVVAKSDISIENGELIQFKPMLALAKYLKGSDLETIKFSNLTNSIEIRDRKIIIPVMDIRSSALDLTASGTHTFDNMVDYKLGLYLSQFVGKKVKQMNTEFGTIEDDGLGRPRIYLSMKGPASDPKFTWDRKGTEQKISDEIRKERNTIRDLLRKEFGKQTAGTDSTGNSPQKEMRSNELELETDE